MPNIKAFRPVVHEKKIFGDLTDAGQIAMATAHLAFGSGELKRLTCFINSNGSNELELKTLTKLTSFFVCFLSDTNVPFREHNNEEKNIPSFHAYLMIVIGLSQECLRFPQSQTYNINILYTVPNVVVVVVLSILMNSLRCE